VIYPANTQGRPLHPGSSHSVEDVGALRARRPVRVAAHDHHRSLVQRRHAVRISGNRHFRRYRLPAVSAIEKSLDNQSMTIIMINFISDMDKLKLF
jgi:hypothetical protein